VASGNLRITQCDPEELAQYLARIQAVEILCPLGTEKQIKDALSDSHWAEIHLSGNSIPDWVWTPDEAHAAYKTSFK